MSKDKARIAVLASGNGSNFEAIVARTRENGALPGHVVGLICNKPQAQVLERAARLQVSSQCLELKSFTDRETWNQEICQQLLAWRADWVILAGYTGLVGASILKAFPSRVLNSHPSLLPKFGGKGMYGDRVHAAVVQAGEVETGITVHLVTERFDEGPILAQMRIPLLKGETPERLGERVREAERTFYPQVLTDLLTGRIKIR